MDREKNIEIYVDLWKSENPIKTNKLMLYFVVQPLLALGVMRDGTSEHACYFFSALGVVFSIWWIFCIGNTIGYQKLWRKKIVELAGKDFFPSREEKKDFPWYGRTPSTVLLLTPIVGGAVIWLIVLVYMCGQKAR